MTLADRDIEVTGCGSICLLLPLTPAGSGWLLENAAVEPWQWHGGALVVESCYADDLVDAMTGDGLVVA